MQYFFHVHDELGGREVVEEHLASDQLAWAAAMGAIIEILDERKSTIRPGESVHIVVRDAAGRILWNLSFSSNGVPF